MTFLLAYAAVSVVIATCWLVMAHRDDARLNRTREDFAEWTREMWLP